MGEGRGTLVRRRFGELGWLIEGRDDGASSFRSFWTLDVFFGTRLLSYRSLSLCLLNLIVCVFVLFSNRLLFLVGDL